MNKLLKINPSLFKCMLLLVPIVFLNLEVCQAEVRLPSLFGDGMVIQRDKPIPVWGWADVGEEIIVRFNGQTYQTTADNDGSWRLSLPAHPAGGPFTLTVEGENKISLTDVMLGDVWLCSGQSNMEWPLKMSTGAFKEMSSYQNPEIRLFRIGRTGSLVPNNDLPHADWLSIDSKNTANFSAIGYYFGKEIQQTQQIPVGLIQAAWGGTMVEGWMRSELLRIYPEIEEKQRYLEGRQEIPIRISKLERWRQLVDEKDKGMKNGSPAWAAPELDDGDWRSMHLPGYWEEKSDLQLDGSVWFRKKFTISEQQDIADATLHLGQVDDVADIFINGRQIDKPYLSKWSEKEFQIDSTFFRTGENLITLRVMDYDHRGGIGGIENEFYLALDDLIIGLYGKWKYKVGADAADLVAMKANLDEKHLPSIMYNGMINPLTDYPIKGVIWYQGESNRNSPGNYERLFKSMITDWRQQWGYDFPFLFVQLSSFEEPEFFYPFGDWAAIREAQRKALQLENTGMAVSIDLSDPSNPNNIHPRDKKSVGERLALIARKQVYHEDILASGPVLASWDLAKDSIILNFTNVGEGLTTADGYGWVKGFEVQTASGRYLAADAVIRDKQVVVHHNLVARPQAVRYAWSNYPAKSNLENSAGLPASPFKIQIR